MLLLFPKIICSCDNLYYKLNKNSFASEYCFPLGFTVTYHAGAMHTKANSISSVKAAIEANAQIVEFDVSFRPDGTPVIIHNAEPSNSQGVFLEKALEVVAGHPECKINLDIKSMKNLAAVDELVKRHGLFERVFYTGVFEDWVDMVKKHSEIPYYLNHKITPEEAFDRDCAQAVADRAKQLGAIGINSHFEHASKLFSDVMHKNGLLVSLWTVNNPKDMPRVLAVCPDNITTKRPQLLRRISGYQK
ncbi:MAG: glycerophosphodiester phosphodiesterase [Clostridia bacterium]|nr:glycerophosphodiester phosphodiesterase [Clostridia bacterium]